MNTSGYRGVRFDRQRFYWRAVVGHNGQNIHIGYYNTRREAIIAYNTIAKKLHGEKATLNPVPEA